VSTRHRPEWILGRTKAHAKISFHQHRNLVLRPLSDVECLDLIVEQGNPALGDPTIRELFGEAPLKFFRWMFQKYGIKAEDPGYSGDFDYVTDYACQLHAIESTDVVTRWSFMDDEKNPLWVAKRQDRLPSIMKDINLANPCRHTAWRAPLNSILVAISNRKNGVTYEDYPPTSPLGFFHTGLTDAASWSNQEVKYWYWYFQLRYPLLEWEWACPVAFPVGNVMLGLRNCYNAVQSGMVTNPTGLVDWPRLASSEHKLEVAGVFYPNMAGVLPLLSTHYDPLSLRGLPVENLAIKAARRSAMREVFPKFNDGFNLVVFLLELSDVRNIVRSLRDWALRAGNGLKGALVALFAIMRGEISLKQFSDEYLSIVFGLIPFVRDVMALLLSIASFRERFLRFRKMEGKLLRAKAVEVLHLDKCSCPRNIEGELRLHIGEDHVGWVSEGDRAVPHVHDGQGGPATIGYSLFPVVDPKTAKYHMSVDYRYHFDFPVEAEYTMAMLQMLGAGWDPTDWWSHTTLSFCVDWFLPFIKDTLSEYDFESLLGVNVEITKVVESVTYDWNMQLSQNGLAGVYIDSTQVPLDVRTIGHIKNGRYYERVVSTTLPPVSPRGLSLPAGMQWVTLGALAVQRIPRGASKHTTE